MCWPGPVICCSVHLLQQPIHGFKHKTYLRQIVEIMPFDSVVVNLQNKIYLRSV